MSPLNPKVELYFRDGCGRCPLGGTPECNVHKWPDEMQRLRAISLSCGLVEEVKWGVPCYTFGKSNVVLVSALKDYCAISFLKGALLHDPKGILSKPGENTQAARLIRFTSLDQVVALEPAVKDLIQQAIEVEQKGLKVDFKAKAEIEIPDELQKRFDELPALRTAFYSLTPGRQRGYVLHFTSAKQSKTRESRIEKCIPTILEGRGFHD
jgi:uncharacterized protein YdeI (YjbR/CyaY-like superfamily)